MTAENRAARFISWGELLWDLFPDGPRLGGAAANAAYHAACLGAESALVSRVGNDELGQRALSELGQRALSELGRARLDLRAVQVDPEAPTGTVRVELDRGEPRYAIATGVAWDRIAWRDELGDLFSTADVICFGTLAQRSALGFDTIERALGYAPAAAIRLCDLNVRAPFATRKIVDRALGLASVVKLNEGEVETIAELFAQSDVISWLLRERGVKLVAVTRSARGASLATPRERLDHPGFALSSKQGDAVGAGDAFSAALGLELSRHVPLAECLASANRYAAHVASHAGGMPPAPAWLNPLAPG